MDFKHFRSQSCKAFLMNWNGRESKGRERGTKGNFPQNLNCMCSWPTETSEEGQGWSFVEKEEKPLEKGES